MTLTKGILEDIKSMQDRITKLEVLRQSPQLLPKDYVTNPDIAVSELFVSDCDIQKECAAIRQQVVAALKQVCPHMNYGYFLDYQFECPTHPGKEHLCVIEEQSEVTETRQCLCLDDRKPVKMESVSTNWWCEVS